MRIFFAILTLSFLTSTAFAGTVLTVDQQASPNPAFDVFLVTAVADGGDLVATIKNLSVTGVHNITENAIGGGTQSTSLNTIGGTFWNPGWTSLDTHLLLDLSASDLTTSPGFGIGETNDASNPGGLTATDLEGPGAFAGFGGSAGMGDISFSVATDQITLLAPRPALLDLIQVVVPAGGSAFLSATFESDSLDVSPVVNLEITAIPEPSTVLLGCLGLLGVVASRRS